ncbi:MAG: hypothetical protein ACJ763_11990, partial [Bdellovibrionia bacterium]
KIVASVLEIPLELFKHQFDNSSQIMQLILKSMIEKQKNSTNEIKSVRMEKDSSPCPPECVSRVFGVIYHVAKHIGMEKEDRVSVTWSSFRQYAQRVFLENPVRLENACNILVKLKMAEFEYVKNDSDPEAPQEYGYLHFFDLATVEKFYEYYQHYYYKGGNPDFFKVDDKLLQLVNCLLVFSEKEKVNRAGVVQVNYKEMLEQIKTSFGGSFAPDQFDRLEKKGLFIKRESSSTGGALSFYRHDFSVMLNNWKILREIDKWNERGVVDLVDPVTDKAKGGKASCPACFSEVADKQRFCGNCGHKLVEAMAA